MKPDAKKILARAIVDGTRDVHIVRFDILAVPENHLVAVLLWGNSPGHGGMQYVPIDPRLLQQSSRANCHYEYTGQPIPIPADLWNLPASEAEKGQRLGFDGPIFD